MMFSLHNCEFEGFTYKCTLGVVVTLVGGWEGSLDTQVCECENSRMRQYRSFKLIPKVCPLKISDKFESQ